MSDRGKSKWSAGRLESKETSFSYMRERLLRVQKSTTKEDMHIQETIAQVQPSKVAMATLPIPLVSTLRPLRRCSKQLGRARS